jgi:hypothetical protein
MMLLFVWLLVSRTLSSRAFDPFGFRVIWIFSTNVQSVRRVGVQYVYVYDCSWRVARQANIASARVNENK